MNKNKQYLEVTLRSVISITEHVNTVHGYLIKPLQNQNPTGPKED